MNTCIDLVETLELFLYSKLKYKYRLQIRDQMVVIICTE